MHIQVQHFEDDSYSIKVKGDHCPEMAVEEFLRLCDNVIEEAERKREPCKVTFRIRDYVSR